MGKSLFITEKPSVAIEYVKVLKVKGNKGNGYIESENSIFTWCVGHLISMSYPEAYDEKLKKWSLSTLPFLPKEYKYEIIQSVAKQFKIVKQLLLRDDIDTIYVCTDSGREGEYIYRLVDQMIGVKVKNKKRVWIDSQTEDEIKRGIKEAKPLSEYDYLADSAYLRAKEDYLVGINFSRLLTLIYGKVISNMIGEEKIVIAVGRVMSCVLGMIVEREIEIRNFKKTSFYKIIAKFNIDDKNIYEGQWKAVEGSEYHGANLLYNASGFKKKENAEKLIEKLYLIGEKNKVFVESITKKTEKKNAPLLFNLAEIQNECSKIFKINPDQTLSRIQNLYEKKMLTYPRTDARVLSNAVAKEISKNIKKLKAYTGDTEVKLIAQNILDNKWYSKISKTKYVDDSKITDHYAIIPTGEGLHNYKSLSELDKKIFNLVVRRFLSIFYPPAVFKKVSIVTRIGCESFFSNNKVCVESGYLDVLKTDKKKRGDGDLKFLSNLKKGERVEIEVIFIKNSETSPPKRYTTGTIILAMENAGKLIEDEELREHIKGSGIGTSATRAEILKKLERIEYIKSNSKTQVLTPTLKGEAIYGVIKDSIPSLLNPKFTASWEKGLKMVVDNDIKKDEFMNKLEGYIRKSITKVLKHNKTINIEKIFSEIIKNNQTKIDFSRSLDILGVCPFCQNGNIVKNSKGYGCTNWKNGCDFFIGNIAGIDIPAEQIKKLISKGSTDIIDGFNSKKGTQFSASLIIDRNKIKFFFYK